MHSTRHSEKYSQGVSIRTGNCNTATKVLKSEVDFIGRLYERYQLQPEREHIWSEELAIYVQTIILCHIPNDCEIGIEDNAGVRKRKLRMRAGVCILT